MLVALGFTFERLGEEISIYPSTYIDIVYPNIMFLFA